MADNRHYWVDRDKRAKIANQWTVRMEKEHSHLINMCSAETTIYDDNNGKNRYYDPIAEHSMHVEVSTLDTVSAIFHFTNGKNKVAALNFASYKHLGGMFLKGSKAQEECLCHESFLFNVLRTKKKDFYEPNRKNLNRALYTNRALYSPNIHFYRAGEQDAVCDIITCAAPNYTTAAKYNRIDWERNNEVLKSRIQFMLDIAASRNIDTLILGAWGCGVFGQNPEDVASIFKKLLPYYPFKQVVFAIPGSSHSMENYQAFESVFTSDM